MMSPSSVPSTQTLGRAQPTALGKSRIAARFQAVARPAGLAELNTRPPWGARPPLPPTFRGSTYATHILGDAHATPERCPAADRQMHAVPGAGATSRRTRAQDRISCNRDAQRH